MTAVYDNWERLVGATLRREQLRLTALRTPSDISSVSLSSSSPSFNFSSQYHQNSSSFNSRSLLAGDSFRYHQILKATDFLSDSNLIKNGHSGDLYYGVLESGIQVAVKKINLSSAYRGLQFMSELEIFGIVNHYRLIPFLGYCLENAREKFLVYKYAPNKDLSYYLRREIGQVTDGNDRLPSLDWATRLNIATATAEALCYLHHECFPPLVHSDIQASSILLDDDFEVRLGSLTGVCIQEKDDKLKRISRFMRLRKGLEQSTSGTYNASCAYDVYCFGKVLLELVSGKLGIGSVSDPSMKHWMANILSYVVRHNKKLVLKITDPSLQIDEHLLMEVWLVTVVAKLCLGPKPSKRPEMAEVLEALEYIKVARFSTHGHVHPAGHPDLVSAAPPMAKVPQGSKLMGLMLQLTTSTTSLDSITFSGNDGFSEAIGSEEVYRNGKILASPILRIFTYSELQLETNNFGMDALLGGGFERVYKGSVNEKPKSKSGSESLVAVKSFNSLTKMQGSQDWHSVVNMLGRISHPNLVKFLGCCLEKKLLVYEFMERGSLDFHLFTRNSIVQPLPWDIRLKILIGAARGLEFLHALQGQDFFHLKNKGEGLYDSFRPSKILLGGDYNAKISGFHVGNVPDLLDIHFAVHPVALGSGRSVAPECYLSGGFFLQSDVYGFGVVLVQMLTGIDAYGRSFRRYVPEFEKSFSRRELDKIMDPRLEGKYPSKSAVEMAKLALLCLQYKPRLRPSMKQVVEILEHIESPDEMPKEPLMNSTG